MLLNIIPDDEEVDEENIEDIIAPEHDIILELEGLRINEMESDQENESEEDSIDNDGSDVDIGFVDSHCEVTEDP
jgi:hypothetical protein